MMSERFDDDVMMLSLPVYMCSEESQSSRQGKVLHKQRILPASTLDIPAIIRYTTLPKRSPRCYLWSKGGCMEGETVLVVPYDPQWPEQYEAERHRILQ